jgi:hypothetical protein
MMLGPCSPLPKICDKRIDHAGSCALARARHATIKEERRHHRLELKMES